MQQQTSCLYDRHGHAMALQGTGCVLSIGAEVAHLSIDRGVPAWQPGSTMS